MWPAMAGERPSGPLIARVADAFGLVLLLVLATYVAASLNRYSGWGAVLVTTLACTSAVVALGTSRAKRRTVRVAAALGLIAIALSVTAELADHSGFLAAAALTQLVLLLAATASVLRAVLTESRVSFRTILGAISVYLIFGLLFTSLYVGVDRLQDGPFFDAGRVRDGRLHLLQLHDPHDDRLRESRPRGPAGEDVRRPRDAARPDLPRDADRRARQRVAAAAPSRSRSVLGRVRQRHRDERAHRRGDAPRSARHRPLTSPRAARRARRR